MTAPRSRPADPLIRLLGADPAVFHPLYRCQRLLLKRGARLVQANRRGGFAFGSPYTTLCVFAGLYGMSSLGLILGARSSLLGAAAAIAMGCAFLLLVVVTDNFDVLVNPREALVLAAHPHDDRSLLLAKLAAIGRSLSILAVLLFLLPGLAIGAALRSSVAGLAFLLGAAAASVTTVSFGLLLAAFLVKTGGRAALDRMMPWIQGLFQIGYLFVIGGQRLARVIQAGGVAELGLTVWLVPPFWFVTPVELAAYGPSAPVLGRAGLAVATLGLLLGGAIRWLGPGLTERLLEPLPTSTPVATRRAASPRRRSSERARLFALLRVHLRSDWRARSEFLLIPLMGAFLVMFYVGDFGSSRSGPLMSFFFYGWMLVISADALTRSSRPQSLWWILTAPIDRTRLSLASLSLVRIFQLAPLWIAAVIAEARTGAPWPQQLAVAAELLAFGDVLVLSGKALFPDFPFSRARSEGGVSAERTVLSLAGSLVSGAGIGVIFVAGLFGVPGILAGAGVFALLRFPMASWVRRRTTQAAERLELLAMGGG